MTCCDRDSVDFPSPCHRPEPPPPHRQLAECEDALLALIVAPTLPSDDVVLAVVRRARRLLREAAALSS
jgi:hypothetical protein